MSTLQALKRATGAAVGLLTAVLLPGCDPSQLSDEQRRLVTGTTDFGEIILSVAPSEVTLTDTVEIRYEVRHTGFKGQLAFALSGLTADVALVRDLDPKTASVEGSRTLPGSFAVRALRQRTEPLDIFLNLTSVGDAGSRVEHPPARIRLLLQPASPVALDLDCERTPKTGVAPLAVGFRANGSGCTGHCSFRWDFDDGSWSEERIVTHVYRRAGDYRAVATLRDDAGSAATCVREVRVTAPGAEGPTQPGPPSGTGPVAAFTHRTTCCPPTLQVDAAGSKGTIATYAWDLSWTAVSPDASGPSPTAAFPVAEGTRGTVTLTVVAVDGGTASLVRQYP
jgi:hypothetical protein